MPYTQCLYIILGRTFLMLPIISRRILWMKGSSLLSRNGKILNKRIRFETSVYKKFRSN